MLVLSLSDDLLFSSRITATARALNLQARNVRTADELLAAAERERPSCVLLDLHNPTLDIVALVPRLRPAYVVCYGSHVDTMALARAREADCDLVWPRSKFSAELEAELPRWANSLPQEKGPREH